MNRSILQAVGLMLMVAVLTSAQTQAPDHFRGQRGVTRVNAVSVRLPEGNALGAGRMLDRANSPNPISLRIEFFPDAIFIVDFDRVESQGKFVAWSGTVAGMAASSATFIKSGGQPRDFVVGSVNLGNGKVYQLRTAEDGTQWGIEIDQSRFPKDEADSMLPAAESARDALPPSAAISTPADDGSMIDVMVLYTSSARIAAGGTTAVQQLVQLGIAETNTAYANSGIIQRVQLVHSEEIPYQESAAGIATDLQQTASSSSVGALRNQYGADVVSLWVDTPQSICGIGYELPNTSSPPAALAPYAYSVVELDCATGYYSFGHEMGHNMGANHAKDDLNSDGSVPAGAYSYSNGYKQTSGSDRFRTIMAYDCSPSCARIQYFSNPAATYHSMPAGIDPDSAQGADNALTLNNTRNIIANFRASVTGGTTPVSTPPFLVVNTQNQTVSVSTITIAGTATDGGRGDHGIASVTVNGVRADNDTATGSGIANWSRSITLTPGANMITVVATDNGAVPSSASATLTIFLIVTSATANTYHVFPQFADGRFADGSYYKTTVMISNPSASGGSDCSLQLRGLTVPGFSTAYSMAGSGWVIQSTGGTGVFQSGYATLQCSAPVEAQLLYSYYSAGNGKISEGTVFSSPSGSVVKTIADEREGAQLGLAIANDSDQTVTYSITVTNAPGSGTVVLPPRSSIAKFISQLVPGIPSENLGQVIVSSTGGSASIIGLRFSGDIFTTIPESLASSIGPTASTYHVFPQFADGRFADGTSYRTTRIYINPSPGVTANCTTQLHGLTVDDRSSFSAVVGPGQSVVTPTDGMQTFQSGYATMECSSSVDAEAIYSYYSADGVKLSEATVFSSPPGTLLQILSDSREGAQVGLAIANDSDQSNSYTIAVYDAGGSLIGSATQQLAARSSVAKFVNQWVPLPPNHFGQVIVSSSGPASIIGLRFTGTEFTTIPETIRIRNADSIPVVSVTRAFTSDTNNTEQTTFSQGQTVRLKMTRSSSLSASVTVDAHYKVTGPQSYVLIDSDIPTASAPPGVNTFYIDVPIPADAPIGAYTFQASVTYNGITSNMTGNFSVTAGAAASVTVTRAFTSDTNNSVMTSFSPGQTIRLNMYRQSTSSTQVTVTSRYNATGPSSFVLADSVFASSSTPPGLSAFYTDVAIPSTAPSGAYTFVASVTFNGVTSSQSSTFTIATPGDRVPADPEIIRPVEGRRNPLEN